MKICNVIYNWEENGSSDIEILLSTTDRQKARRRFLEKNLELVDHYKNCEEFKLDNIHILIHSRRDDVFYMTFGYITEIVLIKESELQ